MDISDKARKRALLRGFSHNTVMTYLDNIRRFLGFTGKDERHLTKKDVTAYFEYLASLGKSASTLNQVLASIKFLLYDVLGKRWNLDIKYVKKAKSLPSVLSKKRGSCASACNS